MFYAAIPPKLRCSFMTEIDRSGDCALDDVILKAMCRTSVRGPSHWYVCQSHVEFLRRQPTSIVVQFAPAMTQPQSEVELETEGHILSKELILQIFPKVKRWVYTSACKAKRACNP